MEFEVELKGGAPWGFRIQGGKEFHSPIKITFLKPGGKAGSSREMRVGDLLVAINSTPTAAMTHTQAEQEIKRAKSSLLLSLQRREAPKPAPKPPVRAVELNRQRSQNELSNGPVRARRSSSTSTPPEENAALPAKDKNPDWYRSMFKSTHQVEKAAEKPPAVLRKASVYEQEVEKINLYHAERSRRPSRQSLTGRPQKSALLLGLARSHEDGAPIPQYEQFTVDSTSPRSEPSTPGSSSSTEPSRDPLAYRAADRPIDRPSDSIVAKQSTTAAATEGASVESLHSSKEEYEASSEVSGVPGSAAEESKCNRSNETEPPLEGTKSELQKYVLPDQSIPSEVETTSPKSTAPDHNKCSSQVDDLAPIIIETPSSGDIPNPVDTSPQTNETALIEATPENKPAPVEASSPLGADEVLSPGEREFREENKTSDTVRDSPESNDTTVHITEDTNAAADSSDESHISDGEIDKKKLLLLAQTVSESESETEDSSEVSELKLNDAGNHTLNGGHNGEESFEKEESRNVLLTVHKLSETELPRNGVSLTPELV